MLVLHVIGALYHQFFLKDGLFRRMWFGRRVSPLSVLAE
jgi:cytochrome b561